MDDSNQDDELILTDILQAHDILLSILLGQTLARSNSPVETIDKITEMVDMQNVAQSTKEHIKLLLAPLKETLK